MRLPDTGTRPPVVVGLTASERSLTTLDLAADEAARRELPLEIVHMARFPTAARHASIAVVAYEHVDGYAVTAPLIVVRGDPAAAWLPVVVGVDGSEASRRAARFAVEAATVHKAAVVALYAWDGQPAVPARVSEVVGVMASRCPRVTLRPVAGEAETALVAASKKARLLVVGSDRHRVLVSRAHCPVAVIG